MFARQRKPVEKNQVKVKKKEGLTEELAFVLLRRILT